MPRILAIETATIPGSVALLDRERVLARRSFLQNERAAQHLAPAIHNLLEGVRWTPREIECIAVAVGPGSFTGLRIGIMTAKTLAYATGARIVAVDSFDVIAEQMVDIRGRLDVLLDAQQAGLYVRSYLVSAETGYRALGPGAVRSTESWLEAVNTELRTAGGISRLRVAGDGCRRLHEQWPDGVVVEVGPETIPRAETVGQLGWNQAHRGTYADPWRLLPTYLRPSGAEEVAQAIASASTEVPPGSVQR